MTENPLNPLAGRLAKLVVEDIGKRMTKKGQTALDIAENDKIIEFLKELYQ